MPETSLRRRVGTVKQGPGRPRGPHRRARSGRSTAGRSARPRTRCTGGDATLGVLGIDVRDRALPADGAGQDGHPDEARRRIAGARRVDGLAAALEPGLPWLDGPRRMPLDAEPPSSPRSEREAQGVSGHDVALTPSRADSQTRRRTGNAARRTASWRGGRGKATVVDGNALGSRPVILHLARSAPSILPRRLAPRLGVETTVVVPMN